MVSDAWSLSIQSDNAPVIRATVNVVNIVCTVRDRKGTYIADLEKDDFEVFEDGVRQNVDFFYNETGDKAHPLTIVLLIDTSGSVKDKLEFEQTAASEFLRNTLRENKDLAAVVQFDSEISLVQDFTYDYPLLRDSIFSIRAGGATKLYDALWVTVDELLKHEVGRRMVVVLSDGADTQSTVKEQDAIRIAQDEDVVIYGIGVRSNRFDSDFGKLKKFAESTGGLFYNSKVDLERIRDSFSRINMSIKNQYTVGYVSSNPRRDGKFREIKVRARSRSGRLKVTHRKGYYSDKVAQ